MEIKIRCLKPVKMVPIKELKPDPRNPNTHPPEQVELLAKAIKYQGWRNPVIVSNRTKTMISGEGRLMAGRLLEMEKVPVSEQDYESEEMEILDIMAQNELDKKAILDQQKINDLILEVDTGNVDLELSGFFQREIDKRMSASYIGEIEEDRFNIDAEFEAIEKPKTKPGDIYQLGEHRLICGDATIQETYEKLLNGRKVDLVFTDPPYNVNIKGELDGRRRKNRPILNDNMSDDDFVIFMHEFCKRLKENMANGAVFYICTGWRSYPTYVWALREVGLRFANPITWIKNFAPLVWSDYRYQYEMMLKGSKKKSTGTPILYGWNNGKHFFRETRHESDVWDYDRRPSASTAHPTEKPLKLVARAIINSSHRDGLVMDPFGGSGPVLIAAEKLNRKAFIIELDPKYCDVICTRYESFTGKPAIKSEILRGK